MGGPPSPAYLRSDPPRALQQVTAAPSVRSRLVRGTPFPGPAAAIGSGAVGSSVVRAWEPVGRPSHESARPMTPDDVRAARRSPGVRSGAVDRELGQVSSDAAEDEQVDVPRAGATRHAGPVWTDSRGARASASIARRRLGRRRDRGADGRVARSSRDEPDERAVVSARSRSGHGGRGGRFTGRHGPAEAARRVGVAGRQTLDQSGRGEGILDRFARAAAGRRLRCLGDRRGIDVSGRSAAGHLALRDRAGVPLQSERRLDGRDEDQHRHPDDTDPAPRRRRGSNRTPTLCHSHTLECRPC